MKTRIKSFGIIIFTMIIMFTAVSCSKRPSGTYTITKDGMTVSMIFSGNDSVTLRLGEGDSNVEFDGTFTVSSNTVLIKYQLQEYPLTIVNSRTLRDEQTGDLFRK